MKIAVSATGQNLDSQLDPRFGRCAYYLVVDSDDMNFEVYPNESATLGGGAGIQAGQFLASKGVQAVITGNCGPNAVQTLSAAGIELFAGHAGTVREVVAEFKKGEFRPTSEANVASHSGMGPGAGFRPGGGMGGGMRQGMGVGRGMGRAIGGGRAMSRVDGSSGRKPAVKKESSSTSRNSELEMLKQKADDINKQLEGIIARINKLEKSG
ncbi:MAG: NifB/NifX family molybdenum-iron cluster-binding protein [Desulfobacterales bacterium]|jgi:predicted Fe-Mo cluster-binding NifX family protein